MKAHIRIEGLRVGTKHKDILKDIDLIVPERAVTAIIGMSGCGKSTLIQLIPRFYDVSEGKILIDGVDVRDYRLSKLRDKIIDIVSRPLLALLSTLRFGLSFWFDKKEIKWIQYIIRADEDLLH